MSSKKQNAEYCVHYRVSQQQAWWSRDTSTACGCLHKQKFTTSREEVIDLTSNQQNSLGKTETARTQACCIFHFVPFTEPKGFAGCYHQRSSISRPCKAKILKFQSHWLRWSSAAWRDPALTFKRTTALVFLPFVRPIQQGKKAFWKVALDNRLSILVGKDMR